MKTLTITKYDDGRLEMSGVVIDLVERMGLIEAARVATRCQLITAYGHFKPDEPIKEGE